MLVGNHALGDLRDLLEHLPDVEGPREGREQVVERQRAPAALLLDRPEPLVLERRGHQVGEGRHQRLVLAREGPRLARVEGEDAQRPAAARSTPRMIERMPASRIARSRG